jgi:hypothetical protein
VDGWDLPASQAGQALSPVPEAYDPAPQAAQVLEDSPTPVLYCPAEHVVQTEKPVPAW